MWVWVRAHAVCMAGLHGLGVPGSTATRTGHISCQGLARFFSAALLLQMPPCPSAFVHLTGDSDKFMLLLLHVHLHLMLLPTCQAWHYPYASTFKFCTGHLSPAHAPLLQISCRAWCSLPCASA